MIVHENQPADEQDWATIQDANLARRRAELSGAAGCLGAPSSPSS